MPRFSKKAKTIFDLFWYNTDIKKAKIIFNELTSSSDILFAKIWFIYYNFTFFKPNLALAELKETDEINRNNPDEFYSFFINILYFFHNAGFNYVNPMINRELTKDYFNNLESNYNHINFMDDWEKFFCEGLFYFFKGVYFHKIENNLDQGIILFKKSKEIFFLVPEDGSFFSKCVGNINLAFLQRFAGQFEESETNYQLSFQEAEKYHTWLKLFPLVNLTHLNVQKGDIKKAMEYNEEFGKISKEFLDIIGLYFYLSVKGDLFYEEGKYNEALEFYKESLIYRKQYNNPLEIVKGYLDMFFLNYQNYKVTKEKEYFKKAEEENLEIKKINEEYPDHVLIKNFAYYAEARLLKFGNVVKRAKSVRLFDELVKTWPKNFDIVKEYLEFLIEDFLISEDQETIEKIDFLMKEVIDLPLSFNSINSYVSQQIILARYKFFIKDDVDSAFEILIEAKEKILPYKIEHRNSQLENELNNLRTERDKWERVDFSLKERMEKSDFKKYIQEAIKTKIV